MSVISGSLQAVLGANAAGDAAEVQAAYAKLALEFQKEVYQQQRSDTLAFLKSAEKMLPYVEAQARRSDATGQALMRELGISFDSSTFGTAKQDWGGLTGGITPQSQSQIDAYKKFQQSGIDPRKAPGYGPLNEAGSPWRTYNDFLNYANKNRDALEAMLPAGMKLEDVPKWGRWVQNPTPIDQSGNALIDRQGNPINKWGEPIQIPGETPVAPPAGADVPTFGGGKTYAELLEEGPGQYEESDYYRDQKASMDYAIEKAARDMEIGSTVSGAGYGRDLMNYAVPMAEESFRAGRGNFINDWISTKLAPKQAYVATLAGQPPPTIPQMNVIPSMMSAAGQSAQGIGDAYGNIGAAYGSGLLGTNQALVQGLGNIGTGVGLGLNALNMFGGGGSNPAANPGAHNLVTLPDGSLFSEYTG